MLYAVIVTQARERAAAQLLGSHCGDVNEKEAAFYGRRLRWWCNWSRGRLLGRIRTREIDGVGHIGRLTQRHDVISSVGRVLLFGRRPGRALWT